MNILIFNWFKIWLSLQILFSVINGRTSYKPDMIRNYNKWSESIQLLAVQNEFRVDSFPSNLDTSFIIMWKVWYDYKILLFCFIIYYL